MKPLHVLCLAAILCAAFWLRVDGAFWGLPFRLHPDEWKYVSAGANVHAGQWNPEYFRNPPGFSYLNAAWFPLWLQIAPPVEIPEWYGAAPPAMPSLDPAFALLERPYQLVFGSRVLSASLGTLTVLLVFLFAWVLNMRTAAWPAAILAAVSSVGVRESHFAVNDIAMAVMANLALFIGLIAMKRSAAWLWYAAGVAAGVAVATKYSAYPALLALIGLRIIQYRTSTSAASLKRCAVECVMIGVLSCIGFLLVCPFPLTDPQTFFEEMRLLSEAASKPWPGQDRAWSGWQLTQTLAISEGALGLAAAAVGVAVIWRERRRRLLLFPALYVLMICLHPLFFVRFSTPLLPWMALFAARGLSHLSDYTRRPTLALAIAAALLTVQPLANTLRSNWLFHQTDTRVQCLQWLMERGAGGGYIVGGQFTMPLSYRTGAAPWGVQAHPDFIPIDRLASYELPRLARLDRPVSMVLLSSFDAFALSFDESYFERRSALLDLAGPVEPDLFISPYADDPALAPSSAEDAYHPVDRLWERRFPGPIIEGFTIANP